MGGGGVRQIRPIICWIGWLVYNGLRAHRGLWASVSLFAYQVAPTHFAFWEIGTPPSAILDRKNK